MSGRRTLLAAVLAGCSDFTSTEGGVARLDIEVVTPAEVEVGQTVKLVGVARDQDGNELDVPVHWRALDTTIAVDSVAGLLTGVTGGKTGRVVARAVDLYSSIVTFTVLFPADTVYRTGDSAFTVPAGTAASAAMTVKVEGGDPRAPVGGRRVLYEVVSPAFEDAADRTVEFSNSALATNATTATDGSTALITLRRRTGTTQPDTAVVRVSVYRPGAEAIPGSGIRFYVLFQR